jgi:hypothetical protein
MLFENLHGVVKKTQAVKLMADLAAAGKVVEKLKGKQKIYWATQVSYGAPSLPQHMGRCLTTVLLLLCFAGGARDRRCQGFGQA